MNLTLPSLVLCILVEAGASITVATWRMLPASASTLAASAATVIDASDPGTSPDGADILTVALERLKPDVLAEGEALSQMLGHDISARLKQANQESNAAWRDVKTRQDWERLRERGIEALRRSLGNPAPHPKIAVHVTGEIRETGYVIRKIVFESRPGLLVTANLYVPEKPPNSLPGILISHSHHSPKSQGELQDMGAIWARAGCLVLVPDHLGHGERRQHPFATAEDFPEKFQVGRQDYFFRYNTAAQLYLTGESLMGWLVQDLMCGVDVLLAQPGVDPQRIAILGAVAGGGDPAGVAAALDQRISVVVPFNFGGPQPETRYPLPDDAEERFDYVGGGSWESTRNLHRSASDGFSPWLIVGSVAPRGLIHAHEFSWDKERDPVWKRYERIFGFYDARNRLGVTHGFGLLRQQPPQASHCDNIGPPHRERIHAYFAEHWGIPVDESQPVVRHSRTELSCLNEGLTNKPLHHLLSELAARRTADSLAKRNGESPDDRLRQTRNAWQKILGEVAPYPTARMESRGSQQLDGVNVERWLLHVGDEIRLPLMLLIPQRILGKMPVVLAVGQSGKAGFLKHRAALLSRILKHSAVCLVDPRGIGETQSDRDRGRRSTDTSLAASQLMLGETALGARLRDVRTTLRYLRSRPEFSHVAVHGDSPAPVTRADINVERPLDVDQPTVAEPLGATLALLVGLYEDPPTIIAARGGLLDYASLLDSQFLHVPFDVMVPGAASNGDLPEVAKLVKARHSLWMSGLVDGRNRAADEKQVAKKYPAIARSNGTDEEFAKWLQEVLQQP